uniref:Uncharacterized protein n=1 Tax=Myoviridae sp. ctTRu92 TaxID=2825111 RepID=A0A8S5Q5M0_9CAUD|nr:MAG TPA: hypothetical protein [Myoviridae sp. ctTRu92]
MEKLYFNFHINPYCNYIGIYTYIGDDYETS